MKEDLQKYNNELILGVSELINAAKIKAAVYVNTETTLLYWSIGNYLNIEFKQKNLIEYGKQILATLSQELTARFGRGFSYTALTRMIKIAEIFSKEIIATLSQQLNWSHFIELSIISEDTKRDFYCQMAILQNWSVRDLRKQIDSMLFERTAISQKPENGIKSTLTQLSEKNKLHPDLVFKNTYVLDFLNLSYDYSEKNLEDKLIIHIEKFILELGAGFAFIERQKRISIDSIDYYLDLLFYHRKLKRLIAIDLKLGKFKPQYKSQMELYLKWLQKNEMQENEEKPIGLLLCSEGNTEHIELLLLDEKDIKIAQYLTELPNKEWFADKLQKAIEITKNNNK